MNKPLRRVTVPDEPVLVPVLVSKNANSLITVLVFDLLVAEWAAAL